MQIGIIGAGNIGATLAHKLSAAGHQVKLAGSGSADTVRERAEKAGAHPVSADEAAQEVAVLILSVPFAAMPDVAKNLAKLGPDTIVVDTANYYPVRDGQIAEIEGGKAESIWVTEQIGRPVIKAFNAVLAHTLAAMGQPDGSKKRIAIPIAGDDEEAKRLVGTLIDETGFDAFDSGNLAESWRQQPGTPAYCTELTLADLPAALASADHDRAPRNRDAIMERLWASGSVPSHEEMVAANRILTNSQ